MSSFQKSYDWFIPIVDQVADDEASLIGSITGWRRASDTFNWIPETMLPFIWENKV